jgi:hypothetical protein
VDLAKVVLETRDRPKAEDVALTLKDLSQQFEHKQIALMRAAVSPRQHARERVDGWTEFFSAEVLPCFWTALSSEDRDLAMERVRGVRVMLETDAPSHQAQAQLDKVETGLYATPIGPAIKAYRTAELLGVPGRLAAELRALARQALDNYRTGNRSAFNDNLVRLQIVMAEADAAWRSWDQTAGVLAASPDLIIQGGERVRGD